MIGYEIWGGFNLLLLALIVFDLTRSQGREQDSKKALIWSGFWIALGLLFSVCIERLLGQKAALEYLSGYLIELSLSVDNLFVFLMIFQYFHVKKEHQPKILFWGIIGALFMRILFILVGISLVESFSWLLYLFGAFLCIMGCVLYNKEDKKFNPGHNPILNFAEKILPFQKENHDGHFFVRHQKKLYATPLFAVLLSIESLDLLFALDSIPAIFGITLNPFIAYTSNAFAVLGLRSLYFSLQHLMTLFHYLHHAVCLILIFIGLKMLCADVIHISTVTSLLVIVTTLGFAMIASIYNKKTPRS